MSHAKPHINTGKSFRIHLADGHPKAINDCVMHGRIFLLLDWADRIEFNEQLGIRDIEIAIMFYAHRRAPHLNKEPLFLSDLDLEDVVYGFYSCEYEDQFREELVLLSESELIASDDERNVP